MCEMNAIVRLFLSLFDIFSIFLMFSGQSFDIQFQEVKWTLRRAFQQICQEKLTI